MTRGGKRPGAGRPGGHVRVTLYLTKAERARLDFLRKGRSCGRYVGPLLLQIPLSPYEQLMLKSQPK